MTLRVVRMVEERFHRDGEDRPIREGRTPPEFLRDGDLEYRTCPYSGSRLAHKNPMNVSALRQTGAHWDEIIDALAWLRAAHDAVLAPTTPSIWDLWRVSQLGSALPWFYILRGEPVPAFAAALAKATLGVGIWSHRMFVKSLTERWSPPPFTAETILELAEASGTLIGETEVCSGGDKMLLRFFDVLVTSTPAPGKLDAPRVELMRFGAHYVGFKVVVWIYFLARRFVYADVEAQHGSSPELEALRDTGIEPPDFLILEPTDLAAVIPGKREGWFRSLADLLVPLAPDRSDLALRDAAFEIASVMGRGANPSSTWHALDQIFGRVIATVERGFRGDGEEIEVPEDVRDRLIGASPRAFFANLPNAPAT